jgi:hypothetical protein
MIGRKEQGALFAGYLLGSCFNPEDGDVVLLRYVDEILSDYTGLHPTR